MKGAVRTGPSEASIDREQISGALLRGDLMLHFQPQISLTTDRWVSLEALLRWRHPERGLLSPASFLSIVEETPLIHEMGAWVLREACERAAGWYRRGLWSGRIAVNVSATQLEAGEFPDTVHTVLEASGLPADLLELEITETVPVRDTERAKHMLETLRRRGIRVVLDDFGTGCFTLHCLSQLPVDSVKIAAPFVHESGISRRSAALLRGLVAFAHGLGLDVIAEGIETAEQKAFLQGVGCDTGQGHFFVSPCDVNSVEQQMSRRSGERP